VSEKKKPHANRRAFFSDCAAKICIFCNCLCLANHSHAICAVPSHLDQRVYCRSSAVNDPESLASRNGTCEPGRTQHINFVHDGRMTETSSLASDHSGVAGPHASRSDPIQTSGRSGQEILFDKDTEFRCPDCESESKFSRKSDLRRHMRTKHSHGNGTSFVCSAQGCYRRQLPWSFARSDKLTAHIKTVHNQDTIFSHCPIEGCSFGPCTLEALGVHIQRVHRNDESGRAVLNATSCRALRCPLWRCGKYVSAEKLLPHVTSHAKEEIEVAKPSVESLGLLLQSTPGYDVTIQIICPICYAVSTTIERFTRHLTTAHLYTPQSGGSEHFEKWKAYLGQNPPGCIIWSIDELLPWSSFRYINVRPGVRVFACPSCPFSVAGVEQHGPEQQAIERAIKEHHFSFLRPEAEVVNELYPYRMQILRLWPEFVSHPVFADFEQPQQQSRGGPSEMQPSFPWHVNDNFKIPDWSTYDFDASM
jgi:uncharacterized C2H2 Zn-finger protein